MAADPKILRRAHLIAWLAQLDPTPHSRAQIVEKFEADIAPELERIEDRRKKRLERIKERQASLEAIEEHLRNVEAWEHDYD